MTDFTLTFLVLENAKKNKLITANELAAARLLLKSEERIKRIIQVNKDFRDIISNQESIITKYKFIKADITKFIAETEELHG